MKLGIRPVNVDIGTIRFTNLFSRIQVGPDGQTNISSIVKKKAAGPGTSEPQAGGKKKPFERIEVGRVIFENSRIRFLDSFVRGGYSAELGKLNGTVRAYPLTGEPGPTST
jgi:hypothetical protein